MQFAYIGAGDQQAAARSGFSQFLSNWSADVAGLARSTSAPFIPVQEQSAVGTGVPVRQHDLPRLRRAEQQPPDAQRVARVAHVRDRRAQHEGRATGPPTR